MNKIIAKNLVALAAFLAIPAMAFATDQILYEGTNHGNDALAMNDSSGTASDWSGTSSNSSSTNTSGTPNISLMGASGIQNTMAIVTVMYDSQNASYGYGHYPMVYFEYENQMTGDTAITTPVPENLGSRVTAATLYHLNQATTYQYRAVMKYNGKTYKTAWKTFTTHGVVTVASAGTPSDPLGATPTNEPIATLPTNPVTASKATAKIASSVKSSIYTAGSNHANGVAIGITDTQARVSQDDIIEFTVQYQNTRTTSLMNTELAVVLPEEYEYVSSKSDFQYDESSNTITLPIGRIASGGAVKSVTFKARAIGDTNRDVKTTATLYYEGGKISASDRDAYHGGSKSVLGASVFGAGFFPQTLFGWVLIILLITVVIIAARRYTKPAPQPAPAK